MARGIEVPIEGAKIPAAVEWIALAARKDMLECQSEATLESKDIVLRNIGYCAYILRDQKIAEWAFKTILAKTEKGGREPFIDFDTIGLLALMIGDKSLAEHAAVEQSLVYPTVSMQINLGLYGKNANLFDTYECHGYLQCAAYLAAAIGDMGTLKRLMEKMAKDGFKWTSWPATNWTFLLRYPDLAKLIVNAVKDIMEDPRLAAFLAGVLDDTSDATRLLHDPFNSRLDNLDLASVIPDVPLFEKLLIQEADECNPQYAPTYLQNKFTTLAWKSPEGAAQVLKSIGKKGRIIGHLAASALVGVFQKYPDIQSILTIQTAGHEGIKNEHSQGDSTKLQLPIRQEVGQSSQSPEYSSAIKSVLIGKEIKSLTPIVIGDIERRSGLYILGKTGMGKSTLITNLIYQDIQHGHGVFFLDPHGDGIKELIMSDAKRISNSAIYLDPAQEGWSFGINVLTCDNVHNDELRMEAYTRAYNIFHKLWEDSWGIWLQNIIQYTLYALVENQGYTLADMPLFLTNQSFRNSLIRNVKHNDRVAYFWREEFEKKVVYLTGNG